MTSVFGQPWWLDAVAPGQWGEATVERNGKTAARLPWARERLNIRGLRLTRVGSPPLTPFLTPELDLGAGKLVTRLANEHKLLNALLADLPPADYTSFTFGPVIHELAPLPLEWICGLAARDLCARWDSGPRCRLAWHERRHPKRGSQGREGPHRAGGRRWIGTCCGGRVDVRATGTADARSRRRCWDASWGPCGNAASEPYRPP